MPVDPNIVLAAGQNIPQFGPSPAVLLNQQATAARLALFNQQQQGAAALRQLYANPQNLDPATGRPTPDAMRMLMTQSPETGIDLRRTLMADQLAQSQLAMARAREGDAVLKEKFRVAQEANAVYNDALKTMTPDAARKVAQESWTQGRDELAKSGITSPDALATMPPDFDPARVGRSLSAYQQMMTTPLQQAQIGKERAETTKAEVETMAIQPKLDIAQREDKRKDIELGLAQGKAANEQFDKPQNVEYTDASGKKQTGVATYDKVARNWVDANGNTLNVSRIVSGAGANNPKTEAFDAFMREHPDATPEQQASFIQSSGARPRSAPAMALQKFIEENPTASADQVTGFAAKYGQVISAERNFGTGQQGNQVRSLNVVANHLDTITELGNALQNGDVRTLNLLKNAIKTEFGYDQPIDFNLAKKIVGDEVVKSVIGSGAGGVTDRAALQEDFNSANTPAQLNGVVQTAKKLIAGQYEGLQQQYNTATFGDQNGKYGIAPFDDMLSPGAKKMLGEGGKPAGVNASSGGGEIPPEAAAKLSEGHETTFGNGQTWTLRNGQPARVR